MAYKIDDIEGIGPAYRAKLAEADIRNTDALLASCNAPKGRKALAETTGISSKLILSWTNKADLMRVSGIGPQYSDLLEAGGVDTVKELRTRNAANLAAKLLDVNTEKKLARKAPVESELQGWIDKAKTMEPGVTY